MPAGISAGAGTAKALAALVKRGLAEERETSDPAAVRRTDGDVHYGLFLTPAGAAAIELEPHDSSATDEVAGTAMPSVIATAKAPSKAAAVLALLSRPPTLLHLARTDHAVCRIKGDVHQLNRGRQGDRQTGANRKVISVAADRFVVELHRGSDNFTVVGFDDVHYVAALGSFVVIPSQTEYVSASPR